MLPGLWLFLHADQRVWRKINMRDPPQKCAQNRNCCLPPNLIKSGSGRRVVGEKGGLVHDKALSWCCSMYSVLKTTYSGHFHTPCSLGSNRHDIWNVNPSQDPGCSSAVDIRTSEIWIKEGKGRQNTLQSCAKKSKWPHSDHIFASPDLFQHPPWLSWSPVTSTEVPQMCAPGNPLQRETALLTSLQTSLLGSWSTRMLSSWNSSNLSVFWDQSGISSSKKYRISSQQRRQVTCANTAKSQNMNQLYRNILTQFKIAIYCNTKGALRCFKVLFEDAYLRFFSHMLCLSVFLRVCVFKMLKVLISDI